MAFSGVNIFFLSKSKRLSIRCIYFLYRLLRDDVFDLDNDLTGTCFTSNNFSKKNLNPIWRFEYFFNQYTDLQANQIRKQVKTNKKHY